MKTYKVKMTRTETYERVFEVQAENADSALFKIQFDPSWEYGGIIHADEEHEVTEVNK